jgi:hypothetical protein
MFGCSDKMIVTIARKTKHFGEYSRHYDSNPVQASGPESSSRLRRAGNTCAAALGFARTASAAPALCVNGVVCSRCVQTSLPVNGLNSLAHRSVIPHQPRGPP